MSESSHKASQGAAAVYTASAAGHASVTVSGDGIVFVASQEVETLNPKPSLDHPTTLYRSPYLPLNEESKSPLRGREG